MNRYVQYAFRSFGFLIILLPMLACVESKGAEASSKKLRDQAVNRPRRIIFNNDGNEPVYFCNEVSKEELLKSRTTPLIGSQVDSIFYCTWSSGFGLFTHNTKVGQVFNTREAMFSNNLAQACLDQGIDPLTTMVEFGHKNGIEMFWSMRMNDTHDASSAAYGPVLFRANKLKREHPEYLIGSFDKRPKYGAWSAVDYGIPEIRDLAFRYCEEVCQNYDVDGIELDFFRHAFLFKCSGEGKACGEKELQQLNDLVGRIREMTERVGKQRKRPILLAVRVPDSIEYCKFIGIDLERWLAQKWIDLMIVSGYTQLNPWEYSVHLAHKYGVKVYPSLDDPRVADKSANAIRSALPAYRGRALNAWAAGVDGIYLFNFFDPNSSLWRELGDTKALSQLERNYFVSVRGVGAMPIPHQKFLNVPTLNPGSPILLTNRTIRVTLRTGENSPSLAKSRQTVRLNLLFANLSNPKDLTCEWNGRLLKTPAVKEGRLEFVLPPKSVRRGENTIQIEVRSSHNQPAIALLDAWLSIGS